MDQKGLSNSILAVICSGSHPGMKYSFVYSLLSVLFKISYSRDFALLRCRSKRDLCNIHGHQEVKHAGFDV
jgi:hypothetical protein